MSDLFEISPMDEASPASADQMLADVALERNINSASAGLTYRVPPSPEGLPRNTSSRALTQEAGFYVGQRVLVPLGKHNKPLAGYIVRLYPAAGTTRKLKSILGIDPRGVSLTTPLLQLAQWVAEYYCAPLGMVLATMVPAAVKKGIGYFTQTRVIRGDFAPGSPKLTPLQRKILELADGTREEDGGPPLLRTLADAAGAKTLGPVKKLIALGLLKTMQTTGLRADPLEEAVQTARDWRIAEPDLTGAQRRAVDRLADTIDTGGFSVTLLHGVTGSGKTEVYLRTIERVLARHPHEPVGVVVLVPEIALTPQTVARFAGRLRSLPGGEDRGLAVLHSGLSAAQRHDQWQRIAQGQAQLVVGARSAIFAPLPRVNLILVDEEHESSYKQDQLPRYHARDLAVKRGQMAGATVILGSATPSLESYWNATKSHYHLLELPERVAGLKLPEVEIVDLREERRKRYQMQGRGGIHLLSLRLEQALRQTLEQGGQAMLLLNRRGYANYIACPDHRCGWIKQCDYCDAAMVLHRDVHLSRQDRLCCHHCQAEQLLPALCPVCGKKVTVFGLGTQRVEEELAQKFPRMRLERMDADTMRQSKDYLTALRRFGQGQTQVLLGTQMIAKGLDFPNVKLVGVISADTALHLPDFRAAERTFQLIAQVAGRAGRAADGKAPSRVIVQTFTPQDQAIRLAAAHDYHGFARHELEVRGRDGLPPAGRMARIVCRDPDPQAVEARAAKLRAHLEEANTMLGQPLRLRGPMACPISRIANFHRRQILLFAKDARSLQQVLGTLRQARLLKSDARVAVDVDPVNLL